MLGGKLDKRRGGHRCMSCRRAHKKCDGAVGRSCSYCTERLMRCSYAADSQKRETLKVVQYAPAKAIVLDSWTYTTACFREALGSLMQFSVLQSDEMIALSQKDASINQVIAMVGEAYMSRATDYQRFLASKEKFQEMVSVHRAACCEQMRDRNALWSGAPLASALLLVVLEMMLFGNIDPCISWMGDASDYIERTAANTTALSPFDTDMIRLTQLMDVINSVSRAQNPAGFDFVDASLKTEFPSAKLLSGPPALLYKDDDYILSALWHWAVLQQRMIGWTLGAHMNPVLSPEMRVEGFELICAASALQTRILQSYMSLSALSEDHHQMLTPFSFWVLIGISQQLRNEQWKRLECDIPALPPDQLRQYARSTLDCIDSMAGKTGLFVATFIPIMFSMGLEMEDAIDQSRTHKSLKSQQACYFDLSDHFGQVLTELWDLNLSDPVGFYLLKMIMTAQGEELRPARGVELPTPVRTPEFI